MGADRAARGERPAAAEPIGGTDAEPAVA